MGDLNLKVNQVMLNNSWDLNYLEQLVGFGKVAEITNEIKGQRIGEDKLIWMGSSDGFFTSRSAWSLVQGSYNKFEWTDWIWNMLSLKSFRCLCGKP